jgi:hypothetical protein
MDYKERKKLARVIVDYVHKYADEYQMRRIAKLCHIDVHEVLEKERQRNGL